MSERKTYFEKLKDPRWQRRRLEIFTRDEFECQSCGSKEKTLHVHHTHYERGMDPWEYPDEMLQTLCEDCHAYVGETRIRLLRSLAAHGGAMDECLVGVVRAWDIYGDHDAQRTQVLVVDSYEEALGIGWVFACEPEVVLQLHRDGKTWEALWEETKGNRAELKAHRYQLLGR